MIDNRLGIIERALALLEVELLSGLGTEDLARVAARMSEEYWDAGDHVDIDPETLYVVVEGRIDLFMSGSPIGPRRKGDGFGVLALIGHDTGERMAARVLVETHLLTINRDAFFDLVLDTPDFAVAMIRTLAQGMLEMARQVEQLSRRVVELEGDGADSPVPPENP